MAREFHQIVFSLEEVMRAVTAYRRNHADFLPAGTIKRHVLSGSKLTLSIELNYSGNRQILDFSLDATQLADPIVKFCAENNIAVPRADRRSMKFTNSELIMELAASAGDPLPVAAMAQQQKARPHLGA
ncbi:MAG: hypothetical protein IT563_03330 [Alphaproteobacteria bacterium]|nr:hypothetical protein [Alphaproteobacteria bacterium]